MPGQRNGVQSVNKEVVVLLGWACRGQVFLNELLHCVAGAWRIGWHGMNWKLVVKYEEVLFESVKFLPVLGGLKANLS